VIHAFQFQDYYLLLDVESGALHQLDKVAFDVVRALEQGDDPRALNHPAELVEEILEELEELKSQGSFDSPQLDPPAQKDAGVVKAMCLHIAHDCNLRCKYCFASTGEFHGERQMMPFSVGKAALDFLIAHSGNRHNLEVDLFGGEPLMNFDVVKQIVAYGRELEQKHNKTIRFTITTNGVALNDEITDYLNREMHNVVLSLDGRREIHDALRPTVNGKGSYDLILPKIKKLIEQRGEKEYYVRGTFTNQNLDFMQDVKAMIAEGFEQISIEPVVLDQSSPYALLEEHVGRILQEYDDLADFTLQQRKNGKWFNFFHFMMDLGNGPCLRKRISGCGAGVEYVAITPTGDIYPCHQFVGEDGFCMGSVLTGEFDTNMQQKFLGCNVRTKQACQSCWAKYFCSGGCAANAYKYNGDIHLPHEITCVLERKRTECAIGINISERQDDIEE